MDGTINRQEIVQSQALQVMTTSLPNYNLIMQCYDFDFENDGFKNIDIVYEQECVRLRTNIHSREEFVKWKEIYCQKNKMCFNSYKLYPVEGVVKLFRQRLVCHRGVKDHKGVKKTSTGCKVYMDVTIRNLTKGAKRRDKLMRDYPCFIKIHGNHNHDNQDEESLNQIRIQSSTKEMFEKYFEQGMTPAQAYRHNNMKIELSYDVYGQTKHSINPQPRSVAYMRTLWLKKINGDFTDLSLSYAINKSCLSVSDAIKKYAKDNPEIILNIQHNGNHFCIVLITPFMWRAHNQLREAGGIVYVNTTSCVNQLNTTTIIPFMCAAPAIGAVPLALLFTSSQDQQTLTHGFRMVKKLLGVHAFYGKGAPLSFLTDNCEAMRKALAVIWPKSNQFLCIFHLLQEVWRWLSHPNHAIHKHNQQELMAAVRELVYAKSDDEFCEVWANIQSNTLTKEYPKFTRYLTSLVERKNDWAIAYRTGQIVQGLNTNIFCHATMTVIEDIVLSRCKGYSSNQLVMFMSEIFIWYMSQRLIEVALGKRYVKPISVTKLSINNVRSHGYGLYEVSSQSEKGIVHKVDLTTGLCTSCKCENGTICEHQIICAHYGMTVVPQKFISNSVSRHKLAILAVGYDKAPCESFFMNINYDLKVQGKDGAFSSSGDEMEEETGSFE